MNSPHVLARISFWSGLVFLTILFAFHFIKPELDPSWHFISEYQVGRLGWLMSLAFLALALCSITLSASLWLKNRGLLLAIGLVMILISASGMIIAAIFITDPLNTPPDLVSDHAKIHELGAMLDMIPFATIFISAGLIKGNETWKKEKGLLFILALVVWIGLITFILCLSIYVPSDRKFGPENLLGWPNRLMIVTQCLWLMIMARRVSKNNFSNT